MFRGFDRKRLFAGFKLRKNLFDFLWFIENQIKEKLLDLVSDN